MIVKLLLEQSEFIIDEQLSRCMLSDHSYSDKPTGTTHEGLLNGEAIFTPIEAVGLGR